MIPIMSRLVERFRPGMLAARQRLGLGLGLGLGMPVAREDV